MVSDLSPDHHLILSIVTFSPLQQALKLVFRSTITMADLDTLFDLAGQLRPSLLPRYRWLGQEDLRVVGPHPIDGGGFADILVGEMGDQKVAIKSYRCYESVDHMPAYTVGRP